MKKFISLFFNLTLIVVLMFVYYNDVWGDEHIEVARCCSDSCAGDKSRAECRRYGTAVTTSRVIVSHGDAGDARRESLAVGDVCLYAWAGAGDGRSDMTSASFDIRPTQLDPPRPGSLIKGEVMQGRSGGSEWPS